jgi:PilZ domain
MKPSERRHTLRMRTFKAARILLKGHHSAISCMVRNLSDGGACLRVASAIGIPERFDLIFDADKSIRLCRQVWHKDRHIGVAFEMPAASHIKPT